MRWLLSIAWVVFAAATLASCSGRIPPRSGAPQLETSAGLGVPSGGREEYVQIGDIRMYYKAAGSGPPIVFLHGGFGSSETWGPYFALLSDTHTLITPDSRGQGRTTIGDGPITYGRMAGDVVRLLDHLGIQKAHVVGYSDGGCTALHLLIDYPDRMLSATLIGTPYHTDNYPPEVFRGLERFISDLGSDAPGVARLKSTYASIAPNPGAWPDLVRRLGRTWLSQPTFTDRELRLIEAPVLVVKVDRDQFLPAAVFDQTRTLIPGARLLYLPDGTHSVPREQSRQLADGIRAFVTSLSPP